MCFTTKYKLSTADEDLRDAADEDLRDLYIKPLMGTNFFLQIALYYIASLWRQCFICYYPRCPVSWLPPTTIIGVRSILGHPRDLQR